MIHFIVHNENDSVGVVVEGQRRFGMGERDVDRSGVVGHGAADPSTGDRVLLGIDTMPDATSFEARSAVIRASWPPPTMPTSAWVGSLVETGMVAIPCRV